MSRKGLTGLYANSNLVPTPDSNNFDTIFRLVGFPNSLYAKKANGVVYPIGDGVGIVAINVGNTLFVDAQFGNNATALVDRQDKPYADIITAQFAAVAGDTILVRPGAYSGSNIGKDGVRYHFENGAVHTTNSQNFRDFGGNSFVVTGYGRFISNFGANLLCSGTGNKVHIEGLSFQTGGNYNVLSNAGSTEIIINMSEYITMNGTEQCFRIDAYAKLYVNTNILTGKGGILQMDGYDSSVAIIRANRINYNPLNSGYVGFNLTNGHTEVYGDIYADEVGLYGTPVFWLDNWNSDIHSFNFYGNIYSTCTDPLIWVTADQGVANFYGKIDKISAIIVSSGKIYFKNDIVSNQLATAVIQHNGGKCIVSAFLKNLNADPNSHGVLVSGAGLILQSPTVIYITDNNAYAAFAAAAQSIKSYRTVSNKGVNINVTELVSVILVDVAVDSQ